MLGTLFGFVMKVFKWTFFTLLVLVAGQLVHWRGHSVSDHVKNTLGVVEDWTQPARDIAEQTRDKVGDLSRQIHFGAKAEGSE